ncbi:MAG TPA: hypothetical protein VH482_28040 [Thermomicrobiales bacterium]|jgi:hypothetical protein
MFTPIDQTPKTSAAVRLDAVMEIACRLAGKDAIGGIHVAISERPTYDELVYYRTMAEAYGLSLTLQADTIALRPLPTPDPEIAERVPALVLATWLPRAEELLASGWHGARRLVRLAISANRLPTAMRFVRDHAANWNAGFQGLHEGIR